MSDFTREIAEPKTISSLRAYALKIARAQRVLRSVKSRGQAEAYQDMGARLIELEQINEVRESLVQEVIRLSKTRDAASPYAHKTKAHYASQLQVAARKLADWERKGTG